MLVIIESKCNFDNHYGYYQCYYNYSTIVFVILTTTIKKKKRIAEKKNVREVSTDIKDKYIDW